MHTRPYQWHRLASLALRPVALLALGAALALGRLRELRLELDRGHGRPDR